jgi:hypothetical protein
MEDMVSQGDERPDTRAWAETAAAFYRRERPDAHFRTSSSTSPAFAEAVLALLAEHPDVGTVVEVGAGVGTLLRHLHHRRRDLRLTGLDLRDRPADLDPAVAWLVEPMSGIRPRHRGRIPHDQRSAPDGPALLLACEFLDDLADPTRTEVWVALLRRLGRHGGLALAVDYVTAGGGPGPLLAYRDGQQVDPVVAPDRNLTSPVDLDAVRRAGEAAGARTLALLRQSAALDRWRPAAPPADPLGALVRRSEQHALTSPAWFGDHWWLLQEVPGGLG